MAAVKLVLVAVLGSSGADQNISENVNYHPGQHYQDLAPLLVLPLVLVLPGPVLPLRSTNTSSLLSDGRILRSGKHCTACSLTHQQ